MSESQIIQTKPFAVISSSISKQLNGEKGGNRAELKKCQIQAVNDLQAINEWLDCYKHQPLTYRSYQKESERLLLWCLQQQGKAFSDLTKNDFEDYFRFLLDPQPRDKWCIAKGKQSVGRHHADWRPFHGPLSVKSQNYAVTVIKSMLNYLTEAGYLEFNPVSLIKRFTKTTTLDQNINKFQVWERMLTQEEWALIKQAMLVMPQQAKKERQIRARAWFLVGLLYLLGLRVNEVATHSWNAFRKRDNKWWFFVKGKGQKEGMIPVNDELIQLMTEYRKEVGYAEFPRLDETVPIFLSQKTKQNLSVRHLNRIIKQLGIDAAQYTEDKLKKQKLQKFSPHWLRHLSASHQDQAGIPLQHIKQNHRHSSYTTTEIYLHAEDESRHQSMQQHKLDLSVEYHPSG